MQERIRAGNSVVVKHKIDGKSLESSAKVIRQSGDNEYIIALLPPYNRFIRAKREQLTKFPEGCLFMAI